MTDSEGCSEARRLHALLDRLSLLPRMIGQPERFATELDDIIKQGRRIAHVTAPRSGPPFASAEPGRFETGTVVVGRREVRVVRTGRSAA